MTEFRVETVRLGPVQKHPNADTLSITNVYGGYPCIVKTGEFKEGDLAVYIPVDSMVPTDKKEFDWLAKEAKASGYARIKAKKLRGTFSMGLLVPCDQSLGEGVDVAEKLGVEKYETPSEASERTPKHQLHRKSRRSETAEFDRRARATGFALTLLLVFGELAYVNNWVVTLVAAGLLWLGVELRIRENRHVNKKPNVPVYDIEGYRKYKGTFQPGEPVWISEKLHGMNARYVHTGQKFFIGSRTMFRSDKNDHWHTVAVKHDLEKKLAQYPNLVLYGEIYGANIQDLGYDKDEPHFAAFDMMDLTTREFLKPSAFLEMCQLLDIPTVPTLYSGPWYENLVQLAEGKSTIANHVREGFVCKPMEERVTPGLGRTILKLAGEGYLLRKEK